MTILETPLYKYLSLDDSVKERVFNNLRKHSLWFSNPNSFNDPFDCKLEEVEEYSNEDIKKYLNNLVSLKQIENSELTKYENIFTKNRKKLRETVTNSKSSYGVLSLSRTNNNVLMWSHYSNSHSGICLEFKPNRASTDSVFFFSARSDVKYVKYVEVYERTNYCRDHKEAIEYNIFTKNISWSYEQEVRIVKNGFTDNDARLRNYLPSDLTGIYFGLLSTVENFVEISELCKSAPDLRHVNLYKAKKISGSFNINFEKISND